MRLLILLIALTATGCSSTRAFQADRDVDINRRFGTEVVTLHFTDGTDVRARALHLAPDTTTWIDRATGTLQAAATADVLAVERTQRGRGAWQGALIAGLGTAILTSAAVHADLNDSDWGDCREGASGLNCAKPLLAVGLGTLAGAAASMPGAALGALIGSRERVVLRPAGRP
jgi:hypothetical protein